MNIEPLRNQDFTPAILLAKEHERLARFESLILIGIDENGGEQLFFSGMENKTLAYLRACFEAWATRYFMPEDRG